MKLNFKQAFVSMTKDSLWKIKMGIGTILCLVCAIIGHFLQSPDYSAWSQNASVKIGFTLITLIISIFVSGYYYCFLNNMLNKKEEFLPCWKDSKQIFVTGALAFAGVLLLLVPYVILDSFVIVLQTLTKAVPHAFTLIAALFLLLAAIVLFLVFVFIYMPFITLMSVVFAKDLKFSSFFNFKEGKELWKNHKLPFYGLLLLFLMYCLIQSGIFMITRYDLAVMTVLSLPNFYLTTVFYQLLAQWAERR